MNTRGYVAHAPSAQLVPFEFDRRELKPHDVAFDVLYAGICHSDIHQVREEWGPSLFPMVPGHEIIGVVSAVGSEATKFNVGQRIGVGVFVDSCRKCENCLAGLEQYCSEGMTATYNGYERDTTTIAFGGYSNHFVVDEAYAVHVADTLDPAGAAPLLCAGITLYSPLRHWNAGPGKRVAIIGLGGLGHMGVKLAKAMGAEVAVLSHSPGKREDALRLGADDFVATRKKQAFKDHANRFDLILDTVSAQHDYNAYLGLLRLDGTMVLVGMPEPTPLAAGVLIMRRRRLAGSLIGGIRETQEMLDFCAAHGVASDVEVIDIGEINEAYERMLKGDVRYRFVIDIASLRAD